MEKHMRINLRRKKITGLDLAFRIIWFIVMTFLSLSYVYMYVWLLMNSFRKSSDFIIDTFKLFDFKNFTTKNYETLFKTQIAGTARNPIYLKDTILTTCILVVGQVSLAPSSSALSSTLSGSLAIAELK